MAKIIELDSKLANQIAAGEVVERPASVVKELVENAIDAGGQQIEVFVEEGGLRKIEVIDNGEGIAAEDVENAFKRHATSKIHSRDDLFRIRTLGFRGEALPSIASVSEVTVETSTGDTAGTSLKIKGGETLELNPHSMRKGTRIVVENLFYNTPARLKYVKSIQTELANIGDIMNRLAMSHPNISFRLVHDGNKMLSTTGKGDLKQTLAGIYGINNAKKMLPIAGEDLDFKVAGYISLPELTRASRNYMSVVINGRYIKNFSLNRGIIEGYGSKLMVGRFPIVVVEILMDPLLVDVNVHPTKQEVRISKEKELKILISQTIQHVLASQQLIPQISDQLDFKQKVAKVEKEIKPQQIKMGMEEQLNPSTNMFNQRREGMKQQGLAYDKVEGRFYIPTEKKQSGKKRSIPQFDTKKSGFETVAGETMSPEDFGNPFDRQIVEDSISETPSIFSHETESSEKLAEIEHYEVEENTLSSTKRFPVLEYIGQMHGTYLFAQNETGLYIVDQHAAQERIKYEYFRKKIGEVGNDLQELLVPIVLDYPNQDKIKIQENEEVLKKVGIQLETFGQNSFLVRAHPVWYPKGDEEEIIKDMIDMLLTSGKVNVAKFREATAIMMSCKKSIKANHYLNDYQARQLLEDLAKCENPFNCPHGRPVLVQFTNNDMEKMFKRIQDPH